MNERRERKKEGSDWMRVCNLKPNLWLCEMPKPQLQMCVFVLICRLLRENRRGQRVREWRGRHAHCRKAEKERKREERHSAALQLCSSAAAFLHCLSRLSSNPFSISIPFAFLSIPLFSLFCYALRCGDKQRKGRCVRNLFYHFTIYIWSMRPAYLLSRLLSKSRQIHYFSSTVCLNSIDFSVLKWSDFQNVL